MFLSNMSKRQRLTSTFFPDCKKIFLADKLLDFVSSDKVSLEELGTTKKLCITFLLRSGLLFCFNPSSTWAHGVTVSTFLSLSFSDFVAVRRNDSTKPIPFFCCFEALVCFHGWRSVAVLKNARILLFKIRFAFKSA